MIAPVLLETAFEPGLNTAARPARSCTNFVVSTIDIAYSTMNSTSSRVSMSA